MGDEKRNDSDWDGYSRSDLLDVIHAERNARVRVESAITALDVETTAWRETCEAVVTQYDQAAVIQKLRSGQLGMTPDEERLSNMLKKARTLTARRRSP